MKPFLVTSDTLWQWVTRIGGILGVIGGALGVISFFAHPEEIRIATALDVSRAYLRDAAQERATVLLLIKAQDPASAVPLSEDELEKLRSVADTLEFYARLAETNKLDPDYLSDALVCAIIFAADAAGKHNLSIPTSGKPLALRSFASKHTCRAGGLTP